MPISVPGSNAAGQGQQAGFTLLEILVVTAIMAVASGLFAFALGGRDDLDQEAHKLAALLEVARSEARISGIPIDWVANQAGYHFSPPLPGTATEQRWLTRGTHASIAHLRLTTEPVMPAHSIALTAGGQSRIVASDGLSPFEVLSP